MKLRWGDKVERGLRGPVVEAQSGEQVGLVRQPGQVGGLASVRHGSRRPVDPSLLYDIWTRTRFLEFLKRDLQNLCGARSLKQGKGK